MVQPTTIKRVFTPEKRVFTLLGLGCKLSTIGKQMTPQYILGTGLSHNGSAVLLADGKVIVGIEKERLTRRKHDGGNDYDAVKYCLDKAGITLNELSLVVQCANFEKDSILTHQYSGKRYFPEHFAVPVVTISHHLAHAYSAVGSAPFNEGHVFILDGCGSPFEQCDDVADINLNEAEMNAYPQLMYCEKDSFYAYQNGSVKALMKDFSGMGIQNPHNFTATTQHSIGGLYGGVSQYCFGNMDDAGKLMGLAPYGRSGQFRQSAFDLINGRAFVREGLHEILHTPSTGFEHFKANFQHYADVARWMQEQVEEAVLYTLDHRISTYNTTHLLYAGGVALNALTNSRIKRELGLKNLYIEPAAGDNGLALGCAYYGWMEVLKQPKVTPDGNTCFGYTYTQEEIKTVLKDQEAHILVTTPEDIAKHTAACLAKHQIVGWFQGGSEFGPRALGHRSILANPFSPNIRNTINAKIKCREDFRPFAPAILREDVTSIFKHDEDAPYMLLVNDIKPAYRYALASVVHENNTSRTQTVTAQDHPLFYQLLQEFKALSNYGVLLNTSFNKRGMPIVETPGDALDFFMNSPIDVLVIGKYAITKTHAPKNEADKEQLLDTITSFLNEIGIGTSYSNINEDTFLPGILITEGKLTIDKDKLKYPGDLLHEAGHIAVMPGHERNLLAGDVGKQKDYNTAYGEEIAAILWSYAALHHLQLSPDVVFHPSGYKGTSEMYIDNFTSGNFIGLPLLEWMGLCKSHTDQESNASAFPAMTKWLRD